MGNCEMESSWIERRDLVVGNITQESDGSANGCDFGEFALMLNVWWSCMAGCNFG